MLPNGVPYTLVFDVSIYIVMPFSCKFIIPCKVAIVLSKEQNTVCMSDFFPIKIGSYS